MTAAMQARSIARPTVTPGELADLIAFLNSVSVTAPPGAMHVLPASPAYGERLFRDKGCTRCHGIAGRGGTSAPDLLAIQPRRSLVEFASTMWNKAPAMAAVMKTAGIALPRIADHEMAALVGYLYAIGYLTEAGDAGRGRQRTARNDCRVCHPGSAGAPVPDGSAQTMALPGGMITFAWNHALTMQRAGKTPAAWRPVSAADIADMAAFVRTAGSRPPGVRPGAASTESP